ncbi:MAG: hypothetical protein LC772_13370, partial [Chloroflexi bacterium]|nr:hypothetical protein [Chloroflexota bacterium]
ADLLTALRGEADIVVLDTPPCTVVADALILAPQVDSIIFVVGAGQVDRDLLRDSTTALKTAAGKPVSFVLNRAPRERSRSYAGYYYTSTAALPAGGRPVPQQRPQLISQKPLLRRQSDEVESVKEVSS